MDFCKNAKAKFWVNPKFSAQNDSRILASSLITFLMEQKLVKFCYILKKVAADTHREDLLGIYPGRNSSYGPPPFTIFAITYKKLQCIRSS